MKKKESPLKELELHTEEVKEILTTPPNWMIRWGNLLFLLLTCILFLIGWAVKYPDIIQCNATITTKNSPQKIFSLVHGKLDSIYIKDSDTVDDNTILAIIENTAKNEDVLYLKSILDTLTITNNDMDFPIEHIPYLTLGTVEPVYVNFEQNYLKFKLNKNLQPNKNLVFGNKVTLDELKFRLSNIESKLFLIRSELELKKKNLERHKMLLAKGVISKLDLENKQIEVINTEKERNTLLASLSQAKQEIKASSTNLKDHQITEKMEAAILFRNTLQAFNLLKKSIQEWEDNFVLKSKMDGKVSFLKFWSKNQSVNQGDLVFTIIPDDSHTYIAKGKAVAHNSGKIKPGQNVHIKLDNFPESEFGILRGKVASISLTPDSDGFLLLDIILPSKLMTSYNKTITFRHEMTGTAEVITEDIRLLERVLYQLKKKMNQ